MKHINIFILLILCLSARSQTYNPSLFTVTNKSIGISQAIPTDARSQYWDNLNFVARDYANTGEVNSYLNLSKYRTGHFAIYIHLGGSLGAGGVWTGGITQVWFYKNGTADSNLVRWYTDSTTTSGFLLASNNLSDLSNIPTALGNLGLGSMALLNSSASQDLSGVWPNITTTRFNGQLPSYYLNYSNLTNKPVGLSLTTTGTSGVATYNSGTGILNIPNYATGGGGGSCLNCNADSLNGIKASFTSFPNFGQVVLDSTNGQLIILPKDSIWRTPGIDSIYFSVQGRQHAILDSLGGGGGGGGSVTIFSFTNGNGFTGTVTNSTTTPALSLTPSFTGLAYSNGSALGAVAVSSPLVFTGGNLSVQVANTSQNGYLSSIDWNIFNGRQTALSGTGYLKFSGTTPSYLTPTQTTADLNLFTTSLQGLVPASGGGTTNFLRADGTWAAPPGGGGSGTVTSFSAGVLSPLFTTSVATATTTPALTFVPSNAAANTAFGNFTGSSAVPSFGKVSLAAMATNTANTIIGFDASGNPVDVTAGTNINISSGVISATGGGGSQTFQQTLTTGSTLTTPNTVNQGGNNFTWTGGGAFQLDSSKYAITHSAITFTIPAAGYFLGDSYTACFRPCTPDTCYTTRLPLDYGITFSNYAASSTGIYQACANSNLNIPVGNTLMGSVMISFNDLRSATDTNKLWRQVLGGHMELLANQWLKTYDSAGGTKATRYGTWTNYNAGSVGGRSGTLGSFTGTLNDSIVYPFVDSTIVFYGIYGDGASNVFATYDLFIDNVLIGHFTENNSAYNVALNGYDNARSPFAQKFGGLPFGPHKIKVVNTSTSGTAFFVCDGFGTLQDRINAAPLLLWHVPTIRAVGFATAPSQGSAQRVARMNAKLDSISALFGYPIIIVQTQNFYDSLTDICTNDNIHPNNKGDSDLTNAALSALSRVQLYYGSTYTGSNGTVQFNGSRPTLSTDNGTRSFAFVGDPANIGPGTVNRILKFTSAVTAGNSSMSDNGTAITTTENATINSAAQLGTAVTATAAPFSAGTVGAFPFRSMYYAGGATNSKLWDEYVDGNTWNHRILNDANASPVFYETFTRSGVSISAWTVTAATSTFTTNALTLNGTTPNVRIADVTGTTPIFYSNSGNTGFLSLNRDPVIGSIVDPTKAAVQISLITSTSTSQISFGTSATINTTPVQNMTLFGSGNLVIGSTSDFATSILTMVSTAKGFLPPRMTLSQATAISSPATSLHFVLTDSSGRLGLWNGTKIVTYATTDMLGSGGGSQTLTPTQNATNYNIAISGGNNINLLTATTNLSGLLDTTRTRFIDSLRSGLKTFNLYFANGLTAAAGDSAYWEGTLNKNTTIDGGGGAFSVTFNTLSSLVVISNSTKLNSALYMGSENGITDANFTLGSTDYLLSLPSITANRTITLTNPTTDNDRDILIYNPGSASFSWSFTSVIPKYGNGNNLTTLQNGVMYVLKAFDGQWNIINVFSANGADIKYKHTIFAPTTGGTVSLVNNQYNIINPTTTLASLTINLPSSPQNNDVVYVKFDQAVSAVTYSNGTVVGGLLAPLLGSVVVFTFDSGSSTWY